MPLEELQALTSPDAALFATIGTVGLADPLIPTSSPVHHGPNGKPETFHYDAGYCSYCAAEHWSLVMARTRFGEYKDLRLMTSGDAPEIYPQTNTFTLAHTSYTSQYPDWASVENADRAGQPLQTPSPEQQEIINTFEASH